MSNDLIRVKGGLSADGVEGELAIGSGLPDAVARFFPGWAIKVELRRGVATEVLRKIQSGEPLTRADADYAAAMLGEAEATWIRRKEIEARTQKALSAGPPLQLPPKPPQGSSEGPKATADDWVRRFWEDASAISDDVLQEIYAQVLTGEIRQPSSCSLRTLRVLRYMERRTADNFAQLLAFTVEGDFVPLFAKKDIPYNLLVDLSDAGLLDFRADVAKVFPNPGPFGWLCGPCAVQVTFEQFNEQDHPMMGCYLLHRAGRELAAVASVKPNADFAERFAQRLLELPCAPRVQIAPLPHPGWNEDRSELSFTEVKKAAEPP